LAIRSMASDSPEQPIPFANKPDLQYFIEDLRDAGTTDTEVILGNVMSETVQ